MDDGYWFMMILVSCSKFSVCQNFSGRAHAGGNFVFRHRAGIFFETERVQFQMREIIEARKFERVPRAVQRATVNRQNVFGIFGLGHEAFHTATDAGETGHFRRVLAREPARNAVGEFARVRAAGAGIDHRGRFFQRWRI